MLCFYSRYRVLLLDQNGKRSARAVAREPASGLWAPGQEYRRSPQSDAASRALRARRGFEPSSGAHHGRLDVPSTDLAWKRVRSASGCLWSVTTRCVAVDAKVRRRRPRGHHRKATTKWVRSEGVPFNASGGSSRRLGSARTTWPAARGPRAWDAADKAGTMRPRRRCPARCRPACCRRTSPRCEG